MLVDDAIQKVNLLANGKGSSLTVDSTKYTKILQLINLYKDVWAAEPNVNWESLRSLENIGTVTATDTYALPDEVLEGKAKISDQEGDYVRVIWTSGVQESDYTIVPDSKLYRNGPSVNNPGGIQQNSSGNCARRGEDLVFDVPFKTTSPEFGGQIYIPIYTTPEDVVSSTISVNQVVPCDDPMWIVFMAAAEYVRNDITKQNQYANLVAQAINSMNGMIERNEAQIEDAYMKPIYSANGETW